jgi:hypothetical protein
MQEHNHNFMRMWAWEHAAWMQFTDRMIRYWPHPYPRTGPGNALDGEPKFDVTEFNQAYFDRLRERVIAARDRGIYVSVMLFQGFSIEQKGTAGIDPNRGNPWDGHPFNGNNNINGINGDLNGDGEGCEVHTLDSREMTGLQEAYIRKVVDTLNDLDNVLWEISNESHSDSTEWQYYMINYLKDYEAGKPKQHPVGMTMIFGQDDDNGYLFASPADWISPTHTNAELYKNNPPASDGKVVIVDTDHLWGIGGNQKWVWKSFLRGLNPIYMDPYGSPDHPPADESVRQNMGYALRYADKMNMAATTPRGDLSSSDYCLANPVASGAEYLVYLPYGGSVRVDLSAASGDLSVQWLNPSTGAVTFAGTTTGGASHSFTAPSDFNDDAVLYIWDGPIFQFYLPSVTKS